MNINDYEDRIAELQEQLLFERQAYIAELDRILLWLLHHPTATPQEIATVLQTRKNHLASRLRKPS